MDLDAYVAAHRGEWHRLDELVRRRRLDGAEADELVDLYQRVATHLSVVRSSAPDPTLVTYLSSLLARARTRSAGTRTTSWSDARRFFVATFPAALYRTRRWWLATLLANVVVAVALGWWFVAHPQVESGLLSRAEVERLVNADFEGYYSQYAASHFAAQVWTNNAWVAALCIAFGVLGLPVIYLLFQNILNVALIGAIMIGHDRGALFFGLILPHGMLELTAVFVAAGVGLRLFWSWVEPGPRTRGAGARARGPHRGRRRPRPGRRAARVRGHRGVRDAVGAAHVGPDRDRRRGRGWPSSPTCSPPGAGRAGVARPVTSTPPTPATPNRSPADLFHRVGPLQKERNATVDERATSRLPGYVLTGPARHTAGDPPSRTCRFAPVGRG